MTGWTTERVKIRCDPKTGEEWRERDGWVHPDAPGLAVTPLEWFSGSRSHEFVITHVRTGMRVGSGYSLNDARRRALMFGQLGLGTLEPADIKQRPAAWCALAHFARAGDLGVIEPRVLAAFDTQPVGFAANEESRPQ